MAEKLQKRLHRAPVLLKSAEDHLLLNQELSNPGHGTTDMRMDTENLKPLTGNLTVLIVLTLRKTLHLLQFTLLTAKMVKIKLALFHSFLPACISAVLLEPCLKSSVQYSTVSWEIRQINAMFRNDFSVKCDHNWLNCWVVKEFLLFWLDKQTFIANNSCLS